MQLNFSANSELFAASAIAAPVMLWREFPTPVCHDVEDWQWYSTHIEEKSALCWPQEDGRGPHGGLQRRAHMGALWRRTTGEGPMLENGNKVGTMALLRHGSHGQN